MNEKMKDWKKETDRIKDFIKTTVKETNKEGVVLGLSGGIDSAIVAVLAKKALGSKNVHCYYLPEFKVKDFDKKHINKLCERFDLTYNTKVIDHMLSNIIAFENIDDEIVLGNLKARIRMLKLYQYANKLNCLVIGTGNKSEIAIGYFTKYGDGAVDFEPVAHLYKTEVFELAKHLDIPNEIVDKPPSAGLWKGQTDEDEIGLTYATIDRILKHFESYDSNCGYDLDDAGTHKGLNTYDIQKVFYMIKKSEHKRRLPKHLERIE